MYYGIDTNIWKNDPRYGHDGLGKLENYLAPDNNEYGNKDLGKDTQNSVVEQHAEGNLAQSLSLKSIGKIVQKGMNESA